MNIEQSALLACLLEATAPKPGNVHRGADFADMTFVDFLVSAVAVGPVLAKAPAEGVGATILRSIEARRSVTAANTNLGIVLLLAPLCCVPDGDDVARLRGGVEQVLGKLQPPDADLVYRAIRLAHPGGLGKVDEMDVDQAPPTDLLAAMRAAADRDRVARQYATNYEDVFEFMAPLLSNRAEEYDLTTSIIDLHVRTMATFPDSLIARKCGPEIAAEASRRAEVVVSAGAPDDVGYREALADLDFWLRSDGNRRNPGTTADLTAATLFVSLRTGALSPPFMPISDDEL